MGILAVEILLTWSLASLVAGFVLGAAIGKGERMHKEEFLSAVFATLENMQASRSLNTRSV
jgi:hypothetical protein